MNGDVLFQNAQNCLTMAAGSDRQPLESSVVPVCGKPASNSLTRLPGVRNHIPYSDHNYGKPLTPPDSCSPDHPEEADTGNEDEGFTRCICGFKHDDGYMICCDKCSAWQHIECVGIKSNCVPDTYLCDMCDPRPLDRKRAIQIQTKKSEEPTDEEEDDDCDVSDHDSDNAVSRVSLPNSASLKENVLTKGKRKKRESTRKLSQKEMKHNKRKRRKRKHISTDTIPVDEETNGPWNNLQFPEHKQYVEADKTVFIGDLANHPLPFLETNANLNNVFKQEQICKVDYVVQKTKQGVVVTEDTIGQDFIIECKGELLLDSQFKEDHPMFSKCDPFVLYYTKIEPKLVMNFSRYGNDARFIRRSCSPTAEVRHVTIDNKPRLVVFSLSPLAKGTEVTIAFEFPFHEYRRQLDCACAQDNCNVQKHNETIQRVEQTNGFRGSKDEQGLVDSSLSNHMDSDSDGDNVTKDKRSRKKLSREDRKLQQYLRQFEKMEKTEKKKLQHSTNGRDGRTGILTPRNYPEEFNGETPSKPCKALRKQGLSQRHQRKIQTIRRAQRVSCSSEPLSPEDNYSSAASTPTTPCVNVVEETNDHHLHDTTDKSFKFPKFKKGSLNDMTASTIDTASRSCNPSPEASGYPSPSKPLFETRLVEVDEPNCDRLSATINGASSPRTDPNCSPSPCHSTYASPTHSESVDLPDMFSRHYLASPTGCSVASFILNSGLYRSDPTHTTLKKRWLLQYANERAENKMPANGIVTAKVFRPSQISRVIVSPRTFPLPYKRRKLMEYQKTVNVVCKNSLAITSQPSSDCTAVQANISECLGDSGGNVSSTVKTSSSILSKVTSSSMTSSVTSSSMMSSFMKPSPTSASPSLTLSSVTSVNTVTLSCTNDTRPTMLQSTRTTTSGALSVTGSDEPVFPRVTGSEEANWGRRISGGSDDTSVGHSSLSSISSTDDINITGITDDYAKVEPSSGNVVGSSSEVYRSLLPTCSPDRQESSLESNTNCATRALEDMSRDKPPQVGSSGAGEGSTGTTSAASTTPGGKKKVSLSEYLNRKRATGSAVKKDSSLFSSEVTSESQSRVSEASSLLATSSDPVSSVVNYRGGLVTSVNTSGYGGTSLLSTTGVSSSTGGVMIEPVSPDEGYDNRPSLHNAGLASQSSSTVEREMKPSSLGTTSSYRSYSQNIPTRPVSETASSSDAMDIDDDDAPSSSTIVVHTPVSLPGDRSTGVTSSDTMSSLSRKPYSNLSQPSARPPPRRQVTNSIVSSENHGRQPAPAAQMPNTSLQTLPRHPDFRSSGNRPSPFH